MRTMMTMLTGLALAGTALAAQASTEVPLGGNAYITRAAPTAEEVIADTGLHNWTSPQAVISTYVHVKQPGHLQLALNGSLNGANRSQVRVSVGQHGRTVDLRGGATTFDAGSFYIKTPGYVKIDLQGVSTDGEYFGDIRSLQIDGTASAGAVFANDPASFYWSRRGASVHLGFTVPDNTRYFYSEITVPRGKDPQGTYYMANGFSVGYFGIQVNSPTERRVLFSVWDSPDGPTTLVRKGTGVVTNTFGGEGTGGQSYLVYNWVPGKTYCFLTSSRTDGAGNTDYTAWFAPKHDDKSGKNIKTTCNWRLIATWKYVAGTEYLQGVYSFLEGFNPAMGYLDRRAHYGNQWAVGADGTWTDMTTARFTTDATGRNQQRLDYAGGRDKNGFYLRNNGFFSPSVTPGQAFTRPASQRPNIKLPAVQ